MFEPHRKVSLRRRTYAVLSGRVPSRLGRIVNTSIAGLIILNVAALMVGTVESVRSQAPLVFLWIEWVSLSVFIVEYLARVWSCVESSRYRHWLWGRLRFAVTPYALIDLLAIVPGLIPFIETDLRALRLARILRILRLAKLGRYSKSVHVLGVVFTKTRQDIAVVMVGLAMLLCIASSLMYYAEHDAQPEQFSSIPATMWWAVATLTTVGYGDVYPVTTLGKLLSAVLAILGIGFVALPTGILSAAYLDELRAQRERANAGRRGS
ncbi:MAG: ion transporter [Phycisphaerales bacterium JB065]